MNRKNLRKISLYLFLSFFSFPAWTQNYISPLALPYGGGANSFTQTNSGDIYISTNGGVYKNDAGTWVHLDNTYYYNQGIIGHDNQDDLFLASSGSVQVSQDTGKTWVYKYFDNTHYPSAYSLFSSPSTNTLFIGTYGYGIYRSVDNGDTWSEKTDTAGLTNYSSIYFGDIIEVNGTLVAAGYYNGSNTGGVFFSSDDGLTWQERNNGLNLLNSDVRSLASYFDGLNYYIFAGTWGNGVYYSIDYGTNWFPINGAGINNLGYYYINSLQFDPGSSTLLASTYYGTYYTSDLGTDWYLSTSGITGSTSIQASFLDNSSKFWVSSNTTVYSSLDHGNTYNPEVTGLKAYYMNNLVANQNGSIFAPLYNGPLYRSDDGGNFWTDKSPSSGGSNFIREFQGNNSLYAYENDGYFYKSNDNGNTWSAALSSSPVYVYNFKILGHGGVPHLLLGGYNQIWMSTDSALTWNNVYDFSTCGCGYAYAMDFAKDTATGEFFATIEGSEGGIVYSNDGGSNWTLVNNLTVGSGLPSPFYANKIVVSNSGKLLVTTYGEGIWSSTDHGLTWKQTSFPNNYSDKIIKGPSGEIYVLYGSIYMSSDEGNSWNIIYPSQNFSVNNMAISPVDQYAYIGTNYAGIFKTTSPVTQAFQKDITALGDYQSYAPFSNASVSWGDFDKDGDEDFAVAGTDSSGVRTFLTFYKYNYGDQYYSSYGFTGLSEPTVKWFDFNNDGYLDLLGIGNSDTGPEVILEKNQKFNGGGYVQLDPGFEKLDSATFDFADYDRDGWNDVLLLGKDPLTGKAKSILYINNKNETFTPIYNPIPGVYGGTIATGRINSDSYPDVFITGFDGTSNKSYLYTYSSSGGSFLNIPATAIPGLTHASADWGDFDQDGDMDLIVMGNNGTSNVCQIFQNNDEVFSLYADLTSLALGGGNPASVQWGDYDHDGDLDILASSSAQTVVIENAAGSFTNLLSTLPGVNNGQARFGDISFDGGLDILTTSNIYKISHPEVNLAPTPPNSIGTYINGYSANLSFYGATDDKTNSNSLTYDFEAYYKNFFADSLIDPNAGEYYSVYPGEGLSTLKGNIPNDYVVLKLKAGTYFWRARAVDASYVRGAWSSLDSFTVVSQPPAVPTNLNAKLNDYTSVNLSWKDNSEEELNYYVERAGGGSGFTQIATLDSNTISFADNSGNINTTYYYRVRAGNAVGYSAYSNVFTIQTLSGSVGEPSEWSFAVPVNSDKETVVRDLDFAFNNDIYLTGSYVNSLTVSDEVVDMAPRTVTADSSVVITFDATQGDANLIGAGKVYMHAGVITDSQYGTDWKYLVGNWGMDDSIGIMTRVPGFENKWTINLGPSIRQYFNVPVDTPIYRIAMVFRNTDGTVKGAGIPNSNLQIGQVGSNGDIFIDNLNQPAPAVYNDNNYYFADISLAGKLNFAGTIAEHPNEERGIQTVIDTVNKRQTLLLSFTDTINVFGSPIIPQTIGTPDFLLLDFPNYLGGVINWQKRITATGFPDSIFMENDNQGNLILTGNMLNSFNYDNIASFSANGTYNCFYMKVDLNGNFVNGNTFFYSSNAGGISGMTVDEAGNTYVTGNFHGWAYIWGSYYQNSYDNVNGTTLFLIKLRNDGILDWVHVTDQTGTGSLTGGITVSTNVSDPNRGIYVAGGFQDTLRYGTSGIGSGGALDGFLAKFDMNGNPLWLRNIGNKSSTDNDQALDVAVDPSTGNAYVTGYYTNKLIFSDRSLTGFGGTDIFVAKYNESGNFIWAEKAGGPNDETGNLIRLDADKNLYVAGHYKGGDPEFGNILLNNYVNDGFRDVFVAKLNQTGLNALPDLEVKVKAVSPPVLDTTSSQITINYTVYNHGDIASPATNIAIVKSNDNFKTITTGDNISLGNFPVYSLNSGDSATFNQILTIAPFYKNAGESFYPVKPFLYLEANPLRTYPETTFANNLTHAYFTTNSNGKSDFEQADTYVDEANPDTNYGKDSLLILNNYSGYNKMALVKFDISSLTKTANAIWLAVNGNTNPSNSTLTTNFDVEVYNAQNSDWGERNTDTLAATWNNKPALGNKLATIRILNNTNLFYYPTTDTLTDFINQSIQNNDSLISLYFVAKSSYIFDEAQMQSREYNKIPTFRIDLNYNPADLRGDYVQLTNSSYKQGSTVNLYGEFYNNSTINITRQVKLTAYLSPDTLFNNGNDIELTSQLINMWPAGNYIYFNQNYIFDNSFTPGDYYLIIAADPDNQVIESDKNNNFKFAAITLTPGTFPDYIPQNPTVLPNPAFQTQQLQLTLTVLNQGHNLTSNKSNVSIYLSNDNIFDASDSLLTETTLDPVDTSVGSVVTQYYTFDTIPYAPGNYYLIFVVDNANTVLEEDETNNTIAVPFELDPPPAPDYEITGQDASPLLLSISDPLNISLTTENIGQVDASATTTTDVYLSADSLFSPASDSLLTSFTVNPLTVGQSQPQNSTVNLPAGIQVDQDYFVLFVADDGNSIKEFNESNNVSYVKISVISVLPDLGLVNSSLIPSDTVLIGDTLQFHTELIDNNSSGITNPVDIKIIADQDGLPGNSDDVVLGTIQKTLANYLLDTSIVINNSFLEGNWYITFLVDPDNKITEVNENNNFNQLTVYIKSVSLPDYSFTSVNAVPGAVAIGDSILLSGTLKNIGLAAAELPSSLAVYLSTDQTLSTSYLYLTGMDVPALLKGDSIVYNSYFKFDTAFYHFTPGNYYLVFKADDAGEIVESNENNNLSSVPFILNLPPSPDYIVENQSVKPGILGAGSSFTFNGDVLNDGPLAATKTSIINFYFSSDTVFDAADVLINQALVNPLASGGSQTFTISGTIPGNATAGTYYILGVADYYKEIEESNENNNTSHTSLQVIANLPDLVVRNQSVSPSTAKIGVPVTLYAEFFDLNNTGYNGSFNVDVYLSADQVLDASDKLMSTYSQSLTQKLNNVSYTFDTSFTPGNNYYVLFVVDDGNAIAETDESNNVGSWFISLSAGDSNPPQINQVNYTNPFNQGSGSNTFTVSVFDNESGVASVDFRYKGIASDSNAWKSVAMSLSSNNNYSVTIQESEYDVHGLMFYVKAADNFGNKDSTSIQYSYLVISSNNVSITIPEGNTQAAYKIISIPYILQNNSVQGIFYDDFGGIYDSTKWRLFSYDAANQKYLELSNQGNTIDRGMGYFLISKNVTQFTVGNGANPEEKPGSEKTIQLKQGWNLIGDPYLYNLLWSDIQDANNNPAELQNKHLRINEGNNFVNDDTLHEYSGAFINAANDVTIKFPVYDNPAAQARMTGSPGSERTLRNSIDNPDWEVSFDLSSGSLDMPFGGLGMRTDASDQLDIYDDFTTPRFNTFLELNFNDQKFAGSYYTKDIVTTRDEYSWNFKVEISQTGSQVILKWDNSYFGDKKKLTLIDMDNQIFIDMGVTNSYSFRSNKVNNFRVIYSFPENSQWAGMLEPAYPNPFSDMTHFGINLPQNVTSQVQINIFSSIGSQVKQFFNGALPGGFQEMSWDGTDVAGHMVPGGVYLVIFKINSGGIVRNLSMQIVKK